MIIRPHLIWFSLGFAAAALAGLLLVAVPAEAQTAAGAGQRAGGAPTPRRGAAPPPVAGTEADQDSVAVRPGERSDQLRDGDLDADEDDDEARRRRGPRDGDLAWPPPPAPVVDGIAEVGEPLPGGEDDPALLDSRSPEDRAAFDNPPAGFDPRAFEIELEPILDRRPARLFRFEPFDPVGIRAGGFTIFPEAEFALAATNNLFRSGNGRRSDIALEFRPSIRAVSNWRSHALEFRATGLASFHNEFQSEDDRAYTLEARGRIDISRQTNVELLAAREVAPEARGGVEGPSAGGARAETTTTRAGLTLNHRFNRLSVQLRGAVAETDFGSAADTATGGIATNDARDNRLSEVAVRAAWAFKPTLSVFGEVQHLRRTHQTVSALDQIDRDADGERYRLGVSFGNTGQKLRGEASIGWGTQRADDPRVASIDGILVDANLAWRPTALTSFLWTARTEFGDATAIGTTGQRSTTSGLEARHAFRRFLIGTAGIRWTGTETFGTSPTVENELLLQLGAEYFLSREVTLFSRYQHTHFVSTSPGGNFDADEVRVGVRLRR